MSSYSMSWPCLLFFVFFLSFVSCGKAGKNRLDSQVNLPKKGVAGVGSVEITFKNLADANTLQGYVVSYTQLALTQNPTDNTKYVIEKIPVGKRDVLITGQINGKQVGIRLNSLKILKDQMTECKDVQLKPLGTITGNVSLEKATGFSGIKVEVIGTPYSSVTNQSGSYILENMPEGNHSLNLTKKGYFRGSIEDVAVLSEEVVTASTVFLALTNGLSGFLRINNNVAKSDSTTVKLEIGTTLNAVAMKLSESPSFEDASWQPVLSSLSYTFSDVGFHTLYVKFADKDSVQSSVYQNSITIDVQKWLKVTLESDLISPWGAGAGFSSGELLVWGGGQNASSTPTQKGALIRLEKGVPQISAVTETQAPSERVNPSIKSFSNHRFIVWGGSSSSFDLTGLNDGAIYNSLSNTWSEMEYFNAPSPRIFYKAATFENKFLIWGGQIGSTFMNSGAIYHLDTNRWTDTTLENAPEGRRDFLMLSLDALGFLIWGGATAEQTTNTGAIFRTSANLWTATSEVEAPTARSYTGGVWTGSQVILWGGYDSTSQVVLSDGGIYDPSTNQWFAMNSLNAPSARYKHSAVWTGKYMVVWGGIDATGTPLNNGAYYDPQLDSWQSMSPERSLVGLFDPVGFWDQGTIWYWGGFITSDIFYAGLSAYKPNQIR